MNRALSFNEARDAGHEMRHYDWKNLPHTPWIGRLDFKVWGQAPGGSLNCYFTDVVSGQRYRLSAFPRRLGDPHAGKYTPRNCDIDFASETIQDGTFTITTGFGKQNNPVWFSAEMNASKR